jgi:putative tryptophan/tyrosine transport system substrate-binding protein
LATSIRQSFGVCFGKGCAIWGTPRGKTFDLNFDQPKVRLTGFQNWRPSSSVSTWIQLSLGFTPPARAAKQATREIPIVMADAGDPVGTGLIASLSRPGGNVTGIAAITAELAGKCVELIRDMLPSARRVAALINVPDPFSKPFLEKIQRGGEATGTTIDPIRISSREEFEAAFAEMDDKRPDAIIVQPSLPGKRATELALKHRVPAVSVPRWFAEEGGLMSYSPRFPELFYQAAVYVDKILRGAKPADLPVVQPTKFELVINIQTAKLLGLTIPESFLLRADAVIE